MKKNLLEWCVFVASALLIVGFVGFLTVKSFTYQETPPDLRVTTKPTSDGMGRNVHHITLTNHGEQVAANIQVEVMLEQAGQEMEKTETLFLVAPKASKEEAWITFRTKRAPGQALKVHIMGYNRP